VRALAQAMGAVLTERSPHPVQTMPAVVRSMRQTDTRQENVADLRLRDSKTSPTLFCQSHCLPFPTVIETQLQHFCKGEGGVADVVEIPDRCSPGDLRFGRLRR
jgi:hypothetical protein